jgi:hypothetical protein
VRPWSGQSSVTLTKNLCNPYDFLTAAGVGFKLPRLGWRSTSSQNGARTSQVKDAFYIATAVIFFVICWAFAKACDRL